MALRKLIFKPGINRDQTNYANEGGWYESNKVRFFSGFPQKIGGWTRYSSNAFLGVCRSLFNWRSAVANLVGNYLAIGTSKRVYVEYAHNLNNITPLISTSSNAIIASGITTTAGSPIITVAFTTGHGSAPGNYAFLTGITAAVDGIPADTLNSISGFEILTIPTSTSITINVGVNATAGGTFTPSGTTSGYFEIAVGFDYSTSGYGWGIPSWGGSIAPQTGWGVAALTAAYSPLRLIYFDKYVDNTLNTDLFFNIRFSNIYYWDLTNTFATTTGIIPSARAKPLQNISGANSVPTLVTQILFDSNANILMAFGCDPYGGPVAQDPLLIRWASQADFRNWEPSDDPGISTAGYLRIQHGSDILRAFSNLDEILVFTESSVTSLQFIGSFPLLFTQKLISADMTLIGPNAVIALNNVIYWMGHDKFFLYNGRVEVIPTTLRDEVFANIEYTQSEQFFACTNERFNEIWWFYVSGGGTLINRYVVYNYVEQIWHYGDCEAAGSSTGMLRTAWIDSSLRDYPQAASNDGYIYNHEDGVDADGQGFTAFITSSDVDIEDGDRFSLVRRVIPDISFNGSDPSLFPTVFMTLYPRNFPGDFYFTENQEGENLARPAISLLVNQYSEQMFVRTRARQIALKVSSEAEGTTWQLGAPRIDIRPDGIRGYNTFSNFVYAYSNYTDGADTTVINILNGSPPPAPNILYLDASNSSSWTTDTPTTFQNWLDLSGNSWTNQLQIINAVAGATLVDLNNTPTTVAASGTKGLRLQATTGGTAPNGTSVQQRGVWTYGSTSIPGDPAYSLYATGSYTFALWIKFNVAPISGSGAYFSDPNMPTSVLCNQMNSPGPIIQFMCNNADIVNPRSSNQMAFGYFDGVASVQGVNYNAAGTWVPTVGVWYNVGLIAQNTSSVAGTLYLYINGVLQGSATITGSAAAVAPCKPIVTQQLALNGYYNTNLITTPWDYGGDITYSTLKIWNSALSASNIAYMFNSEKTPFGY